MGVGRCGRGEREWNGRHGARGGGRQAGRDDWSAGVVEVGPEGTGIKTGRKVRRLKVRGRVRVGMGAGEKKDRGERGGLGVFEGVGEDGEADMGGGHGRGD